ncbi:hypothetical protein ASPCADRAFT_10866 [Aspergillus carbonarius ITEM 5010]|uniref:Uncharacterized protein n=1 Tax=Aspergillus carbonarius (strain ITEM 5010) TaxID=602072 RepID=A0A1R3R6U9_ASPC5|nr:hypothetical protein ASPCADRAFT_10866 [Aspergillus carbonarius ITEM 5010]
MVCVKTTLAVCLGYWGCGPKVPLPPPGVIITAKKLEFVRSSGYNRVVAGNKALVIQPFPPPNHARDLQQCVIVMMPPKIGSPLWPPPELGEFPRSPINGSRKRPMAVYESRGYSGRPIV